MAYKQADFQPVLPNITDDSMREVDADIEMVRRQNESHKETTKGASERKTRSPEMGPKSGGVPPDAAAGGEQKSSLGRKIVIGILIVVIIVLLILLIYQIYKYYTIDEVPLIPETGGGPGGPPQPPHRQPNGNTRTPPSPNKQPAGSYVRDDGVVVMPQSTGGIPQSVRNLDNDVLSQYIKKGGNASIQRREIDAKEQTRARNIGHKSMLRDTQRNEHTASGEMARISQIIDETREAHMETYTDGSDIPSREDILQQMQKDMVRDQEQSATLESIEEEHGDNIINNFLSDGDDEDANSVKSEDGGCQFVLTKGKNMGQPCGRKRSTETRCHRHRNK